MRFAMALAVGAATIVIVHGPMHAQDGIYFRSGVDLVGIIATVTDRAGRFVSGLTQQDFIVYEDDRAVDVSLFSAGHVPVSLGFVLDTSESMAGKKSVKQIASKLKRSEAAVRYKAWSSRVRLTSR